MKKEQFVSLLHVKIDEATKKVNDLNHLPLCDTRRYAGYVSFLYEKECVIGALNELKKWQDVVLDLLIAYFGSKDELHCVNFKQSIVSPKKGFNYKEELQQEYKEGVSVLDGILESLSFLDAEPEKKGDINGHTLSQKIFIVHGHDEKVRLEVESFVRSLGYMPIVLFKEANKGQTIIEKIESNVADVCFSIVLYTSCDEGRIKGETNWKPRARQNVVFEHGYMCAKLGRNRVVALLESGVEQPGDLAGVIYTQLDEAGAWKLKIVKEMKAVGLQVDANMII